MNGSNTTFLVSLVAGGAAGTAVDISLFPLDTIKTRLQSQRGFWKSGGFKGIYAGIGPAAVGSAPNAAVFFCTYDGIKRKLYPLFGESWSPLVHMFAASCGEVTACVVRVPVEIVKQRCQISASQSVFSVLSGVIQGAGLRGLYQGYFSTLLREVPFSLIQFPLWEGLKSCWLTYHKAHGIHEELGAARVSICGAVAGGISAAITTPMDVAKTRIMLNTCQYSKKDVPTVLREVYSSKGIKGLFAGILPRMLWISIGGAIFFGVYERSKLFLLPVMSL